MYVAAPEPLGYDPSIIDGWDGPVPASFAARHGFTWASQAINRRQYLHARRTLTRLLELGVAPYLLNATLNGIMAQRLVRTLCPHCKQKVEFNRAEEHQGWDALVAPWKSNRPTHVYKPVGCLDCRMTGYMGRVGIYETLMFTATIKTLVQEKAEIAALREQGFKEGMKPLRISGAMKVGAGLTTVDEVLKVAPPVRDAGDCNCAASSSCSVDWKSG